MSRGLLRNKILEWIETTAAPEIRVELIELLGRPGYALDPEGACRAGRLALEIHQAVKGEAVGRAALLAAVAVELQMEAAYVFDDVADAASEEGRGEDLSLAIALLTAGFAAAGTAATASQDRSGALSHFCSTYSEACAGQFLDARLQRRGRASLKQALDATCSKAGGLGMFVTGFAARVAGADPEGIALFDRFGSHMFTFAQLVDDLRDACDGGQDSDLAQGKATLPIVYYGGGGATLVPSGGMLSDDIRRRYESSSAPLYVAILAYTYLSRAKEDLDHLARHGYAVEGLVGFLENVDSDAREILGAARSSLVA